MTFMWYLLAVAVLAIIIRRPELRRQMLLAALFALPIVFVQPVLTGAWSIFTTNLGLLFAQVVSIGSLAALAAALYALFLDPRLSPAVHPHRQRLGWLALSPVVTIGLALIFRQPVISGLLAALIVDLVIIVFVRRELIWDVIVSGAGFGALYVVLLLTATIISPGEWSSLIFNQSAIGLTAFSVPIEELLFVFLFGALLGPLFAATKRLRSGPTTKIDPGTQRLKVIVGLVILACSTIATIWIVIFVILPPSVSAAQPLSAVPLTYQPVIRFSRPVSRQKIEVTIEPHVEGQVVFERSAFSGHAFRVARFIPNIPFDPAMTYRVSFSGIGSLAGIGSQTASISFSTQPLPTVTTIGGSGPVNPCGPIPAVLDRPTDAISSFSFTLEPDGTAAASLEPDQQTYQLQPTACLRQGAPYIVHAWRQVTLLSSDGLTNYTSDNVLVASIPVTTASEPQVLSVTPSGGGVPLATSQIVITFADAMPPDPAFLSIRLDPKPAGQWSWPDERHLFFTATEPLQAATTYRITIPVGTSSVNGGKLTADLGATFSTIGPIAVPSVSPANKTKGYTVNGHLRLTFDQPVDHSSAETAFSLTPKINGTIVWQGTTMEFIPEAPLARNTTYTITVATGVTGPGGLPSTAALASVFTTEVSQAILPIAIDYQDQALSCEAAALKMALAGKGVKVTERDIMKLVGYDPTPHRGNVWGDPNKAFVGLITGRQNTTGYGVHWDPIAAAARHWRPATAFSGWTPVRLAAEIAKGNPVVIWGVIGRSYADPWKTTSGKTIKAWKGEHARTVVGFVGPAEAPTAFVINDPYVGRITWTTATLISNWSTFGNSGVVVE